MLILKLWYLLYFASASCLNPFLNLVFRRSGLSEQQVGTIAALRPWVGLPCGAVFSGIADKWKIHRSILLATFVLSTIVRVQVAAVSSFAATLTIMLLAAAVNAPVTIIADAAAIAACPKEGEYGRQRLWGAVGWGTMSFVSGICQKHFGSWSAFVLFGILAIGTLWPSLRLPWAPLHGKLEHQHHNTHAVDKLDGTSLRNNQHRNSENDQEEEEEKYLLKREERRENTIQNVDYKHRQHSMDSSPVRWEESSTTDSTAAADGHALPDAHDNLPKHVQIHFWTKLSSLLSSPEALLFFATVVVMGFAVGTIESFLFLYLDDLGGSETLMGLTLSVTCIAETFVFYFAGTIMRKLGLVGCFHLCFLAFLIRLGSYATLVHWGSPWAVLPIELLHGITFGLTWSAGTAMSAAIAPPGLEATTQSAFQGLMFGLGYGSGALVAGSVYKVQGPQMVFAVAFGVVATGWAGTTIARAVLEKWGWIGSGASKFSGKVEPIEVEIVGNSFNNDEEQGG